MQSRERARSHALVIQQRERRARDAERILRPTTGEVALDRTMAGGAVLEEDWRDVFVEGHGPRRGRRSEDSTPSPPLASRSGAG